ncbi:MAG: glycosyltransferase family 2 protein [Robiginitomaculum sp.]|nr:glycosyltransferase family 2 protein [Robiginitomaculum sp.]
MTSPAPYDITTLTSNFPNKPAPILSVLIPYYHDDPLPVLAALLAQLPVGVEVILYDDGTQDEVVNQRIRQVVLTTNHPVQLLICAKNNGRSTARNQLTLAANGQYLLFLDADMQPGNSDFLQIWMNEITNHRPAVVFGGFLVPEQVTHRDQRLHRAISAASDCLSAQQRMKIPAKHVCTSNLLVRRDVLDICTFDSEFVGWGWEDVEWAARAAQYFAITHIDNPAVHLGLESADTLVARYRDSAKNYAKFVKLHPQLAKQLPSYRTAQIAKRIPGLKLFRPVLAALAKDRWHVTPMKLRILAIKLWRAGWYAEQLV